MNQILKTKRVYRDGNEKDVLPRDYGTEELKSLISDMQDEEREKILEQAIYLFDLQCKAEQFLESFYGFPH